MRFVADENFSGSVVRHLRNESYDVFDIAESLGGTSDTSTLAIAQQEAQVILTNEKDFGELAFRSKLTSAAGIVLFRLYDIPFEEQDRLAGDFLVCGSDLQGHFTVVRGDKMRKRPLSDSP